jgi:hypothetical protein
MTDPLSQLLQLFAQREAAITPRVRDAGAPPLTSDANGGPSFDDSRYAAAVLEEYRRISLALFQLVVQPQLRAQMKWIRQVYDADGPTGQVSPPAGHDGLFEQLSTAQSWVIQHPVEAQTIFAALVEEGRRFAQSAAGARWAAALADSDLVRKGRLVWEATTLNLLEERPGSVLPTTYLDVLRKAVATREFEDLLSRLRQGRGTTGDES